MNVETLMLDVGQGHRLYVESFGNPEGLPVVFLHGGPGSGCQPGHRDLFDPARFRAVLFDQRGAGRSQPKGARHANTTADLIADMEKIRSYFGIRRWMIVGGSWGATLALAYAQTYPEAVLALALRAVYLGTRAELEAAFGPVLARFHPDLHAAFLAHLPATEQQNPLENYWRRILSPDPEVHLPAAWRWYAAERALSELIPPPPVPRNGPAPATPFMEAHYFHNNCFLTEGQIRAGLARLSGIPAVLVQGRYDLLCPPATTHALQQNWPGSRILYAEAAGHSMSHPAVASGLSAAIAQLYSELTPLPDFLRSSGP